MQYNNLFETIGQDKKILKCKYLYLNKLYTIGVDNSETI